MTNLYAAPVYKLKELNNIFIEMTAKNCNYRCKNCYIDFGVNNSFSGLHKNVKDFISIDRVKEMLNDTKYDSVHCIYLTGAEPMTHPDFNSILRLCLKRTNVCICTNGSFLNEKKIRFLKKVEEEGEHQIYFKLSVVHFDEAENDKIKYRGNFRQTIFALKTLSRYNFISVLNIPNYYNLDKNMLTNTFMELFNDIGISNTDIQITVSHPSFKEDNFLQKSEKTDCMYSRTLGANGVYSCPFLSNDYRGRLGTSFKNYSESVTAETDFCATCSRNNDFIFAIG